MCKAQSSSDSHSLITYNHWGYTPYVPDSRNTLFFHRTFVTSLYLVQDQWNVFVGTVFGCGRFSHVILQQEFQVSRNFRLVFFLPSSSFSSWTLYTATNPCHIPRAREQVAPYADCRSICICPEPSAWYLPNFQLRCPSRDTRWVVP